MKVSLININVNACTFENSWYTFSSYNLSILIFHKVIKKYNDFQQKDISFKLRKCRGNFLRLVRHFLPATFCLDEREILSTQST